MFDQKVKNNYFYCYLKEQLNHGFRRPRVGVCGSRKKLKCKLLGETNASLVLKAENKSFKSSEHIHHKAT
jgi:hypothetical protein